MRSVSYCGMQMNPNGTSGGTTQVERADLCAVDVDDLSVHRRARVEDPTQNPIPSKISRVRGCTPTALA